MNITLERKDTLNGIIKVELSPADYQESLKKTINDYARKASLPGFRPGKVPPGLIRKMIGKSVLVEELNKTLSDKINAYVEAENLNLLGYPLPLAQNEMNLDAENLQSYHFDYEVGFSPDFNVSLEFAKPFVRYTVVPTDQELDEEIENLRERYGDFSYPEVSEAGDILYGKLFETDASGAALEGGLNKMIALNPKRINAEGLKIQMTGRKPEDQFDISIDDIFPTREDAAQFFGTEDSLDGRTFRFSVAKLNRMGKADLDQAFFDKVLGVGEATTIEEFRDKLRANVAGYYERDARARFRNHVVDALIDAQGIDLPHDFLKRFLFATDEQKRSFEEIQKSYPGYAKSVAWSLVISRLQKDHEGLQVEKEDMEAVARRKVLEILPNAEEDKMQQFIDYFLNDKSQAEQIFSQALEDKAFQFLQERIQVEDKTVTSKEYAEIR